MPATREFLGQLTAMRLRQAAMPAPTPRTTFPLDSSLLADLSLQAKQFGVR
jgi:hypothetical protein